MPHIVLEKINSTKEAYEAITPFANKIEGGILKVMDKYINASEQSALIESLAIENGVNQSFFVQLTQKKSSLTVRLLPLTDPEKTDGVKTIMATIAKQIKDANPTIEYGKNNLESFLIH
jgi:CHASE3 domain sensor protein